MDSNRSRPLCAVSGCNVRRSENISCFTFPKDTERCHEWISYCNDDNLLSCIDIHKKRVICMYHFEDNQFLNKYERNRLIKGAVPSIVFGENCGEKSNMMKTESRSLSSSEESVVDDLSNVIHLVKNEDVKPDVSNLDVNHCLSDTKQNFNISDNEGIEDDITIKEESLDEQEDSCQIESIFSHIKTEYSDSDEQKKEYPIYNYENNYPSELSIHMKESENFSIKLDNFEYFDNGKSSNIEDFNSDKGLNSPVEPHSCDVCSINFSCESDLIEHQKIHSDDRLYFCNVCDLKFKGKHNLIEHQKTHKGETPYSCDICYKSFSSKSYIKIHKRIHTAKNFTCDVCNEIFSERSDLRSHRKTHKIEKKFICDICNKGFSQKGYMKIHRNIHTGERSFSCNICNTFFSDKSSLKSHRKIHNVENKFSCDNCDRLFSCKSSMKAHKRIFTGKKPFICQFCLRKFSDKCSFIKHGKIHESTD